MSFSLIESKVRPGYYNKQTSLAHKYTGISANLYFRFLLDLDVTILISENKCEINLNFFN